MIIGLTGPTGAGKSSASDLARSIGFNVVDCDKLARVAVEKGTEGLKALVSAFGDEILNSDGGLNRKALAQKAFSSHENTELLNKTLLPHIVELVEKQAIGEKVILDAPTLFESGIDSMCDTTVAVLCDKEIRLSRIVKRDNLDTDSALLRINAGKPDDFYIKNAEHIVYNNGDNEDFLNKFSKIISEIQEKIN